jgi:nicotinate phosphoribosyltransferase
MIPRPQNLTLLTDLYELTMACAHWKAGTGQQESVFHLFFRRNPFKGGFSIACGLASAVDYLRDFRFEEDDLAYLASLMGNDGNVLFERGFIDALRTLPFTCDIDAIPEGTVVFPHEPLVRVRGPMIQAQLLETTLLNLVNFQTLIATKAARVCLAAETDAVLEFGLRRAQGIDGGITASRAAYVGGCAATSNVLAGKLYGIPVKGTHAHSWVMAFPTEEQAFRTYAEAMPNNCILLVDTYDTLAGVRHAIETGRELRKQGHELGGIRLDSGDLAWLSIEARKLLDAAGFPEASILASSELDEHVITSLKEQGAAIDVWGVGTRLATAYDQPALGGVYKLGALRAGKGNWDYKVKLSEQAIKTSNPGIQQVRRFRSGTECLADVIYDTELGIPAEATIVDPLDMTRRKRMRAETLYEDLLVPVFRTGKLVYKSPALPDVRRRTSDQLRLFHSSVKRFLNPHQYPVGLELELHNLKTQLILQARGL